MMIILIVMLSLVYLSMPEEILRRDIGQDVTFSCTFDNASQFDQVSFMHQTTGDILSLGQELFVEQSSFKLIRFSLNRLDLKIISVNQNDSGLYTCMLNDDKLSSFLLQIFVPPRFVSYSPIDAGVSYPEGSSINLSCHAYAIPPANITWIYRNKDKQSKTIHYGSNVYMTSLEPSDSGSYECIASNDYHPQLSRYFYVTVQYPPNVTINKLIDLHTRPLQLTCEICSMPLSHVQWRKSGERIENNEHFKIKKTPIIIDNKECFITVLTIFDSSNHDISGRYECQADNLLGHYSDHIDFETRSSKEDSQLNAPVALLTYPKNSSRSISQLSDLLFLLILLLIECLC